MGFLLVIVVFLGAAGSALADDEAEDIPGETVQGIPLPRPRPAKIWDPNAPIDFNQLWPGEVTTAPSDCRLRLNAIAEVETVPRLIGPGECGGGDMVYLRAVVLYDKSKIPLAPAPALRCPMAESVARWVRDEVAVQFGKREMALKSIENFDSFDCRGRNRIVGARLSEHGKGNALDVRMFKLDSGKTVDPTDVHVAHDLRDSLREGACLRFMTVLGPGSDGYHENHIHLDLAERRNGYRICQWAVRDPPPPSDDEATKVNVPLPPPRPDIPGEQRVKDE